MAEKRKREKGKHTLTSAQEVSYARDFKMADQAGGYTAKKGAPLETIAIYTTALSLPS